MTASAKRAVEHRRRRRKVAAALSAGLVFGVGVASTLAGWNVDEYAASEFHPRQTTPRPGAPSTATTRNAGLPGSTGAPTDAPLPTAASSPTAPPVTSPPSADPSPTDPPEPGTFLLMGSTDGATYADHASASSAAMIQFSERAARLSPGEGVTAAFALRLSRVGSGVGQVKLAVTVSGSGEHLSYGMYTTAGFGCRLTTAATATLIPAGTPLSGTTTSSEMAMPTPAAGTTEGAPIYVCIKVKASNALVPGSKHAASWAFRADAA